MTSYIYNLFYNSGTT